MRLRESMINIPNRDVRSELLELGMNQETSTMAVPFVWFTPSTSDPYSPVIIMLVESIQHRLRTMGYRTRGDGWVDALTDKALANIAGPDWTQMPWINVIGFVLHAKKRGAGKAAPMGLGSLGDYGTPGYYGSLGQVPTLPWLVNEKGTCVPTNPQTLASFMNVQNQANRVLKASGKSLLKVDGLLGKKTVDAVNSILGSFYKDCNAVAQRADSIAASVRSKADAGGAPVSVKAPPSLQKPVVSTDPRTGQEIVTYKASIFPFDLGDPMTLAAVGIGGLLIWSAFKQKPKKRPKAKAKRPRRRRLPRRRVTQTYY